jgi:hypothetical protein
MLWSEYALLVHGLARRDEFEVLGLYRERSGEEGCGSAVIASAGAFSIQP